MFDFVIDRRARFHRNRKQDFCLAIKVELVARWSLTARMSVPKFVSQTPGWSEG